MTRNTFCETVLTLVDAEHYYLGYHIWDIPLPELMAKGEMQKNVRCQPARR